MAGICCPAPHLANSVLSCSHEAWPGFPYESQLQLQVAIRVQAEGFWVQLTWGQGLFDPNIIPAVVKPAATARYIAAPEGGTRSWPSGQPLQQPQL
jgi:hypothetical protein